MTPAPDYPLNSRKYHLAKAARHTADADWATDLRALSLAAWHRDRAAWHTAEAQTAPKGMPAR